MQARHNLLVAGFCIAVFFAAALLFGLEPMFSKMALPLFGGAPAIWNAAFASFTLILLAGYIYAHALTRVALKYQLLIHGSLLLAGAWPLPLRASPAIIAVSEMPSIAMMALLTARVGLPFFALSATAPLAQVWFSLATRSRDPYRLFAASSLGSVLALLAYPFLVEPFAGLAFQSRLWTAGYVASAALLLACGAAAATLLPKPSPVGNLGDGRINGAVRLSWMIFAAIPVALLMGLTSYLEAETVFLPFIWTLPLALYLAAYSIVFSGISILPVLRLTPLFVLPLALLLTVHQQLAEVPYIILSLGALFLLTLGITAQLHAERPHAEHLTEFYFWIGIGGGLGGIFAAFAAPLLFPNVGEYPLALTIGCMLLPGVGRFATSTFIKELIVALAVVMCAGLLTHFAPVAHVSPRETALFWLGLAAGACASFSERRLRFGLCIGALLLYGALLPDPAGRVVACERNFFGPKRILVDPSGIYRFLLSGGTVHGIEADGARRTEPLAYYSRSGPLGDIFSAGATRFQGGRIAVIGLGIGALACYGSPGQFWSFYELDPAVIHFATDGRFFSALSSCTPGARVVPGDARLSLEREPPQAYSLMVLDAYNSDHVPIHLLTREALWVYLRQLASSGVLAFHISNRHFDFAPLLAALARDAKLSALQRDDLVLSAADLRAGKLPSSWVVLTRAGQMLPALVAKAGWHQPSPNIHVPVWSDDYSSLMTVLR